MKKLFAVFVFPVLLFSCSKNSDAPVTPPIVIPIPPANNPITTLPAGWRIATTFMNNFPTGIQLYSFDSIFNGQQTKAFCLAYDSKITSLEFKPALSAVAKTPTAFYNDEQGTTYACINGGFFGGNQSFSLVKYNNVVSSPNIKALTRVFNGNNTSYFPTRAAFGISNTGAPSVAWVYNVGAGNDLIYSYPAPSPNEINTAPQPVPTETFPAGGSIWQTVSAIGGSPVLIKNSAVQITDKEELIVIDNASSRARSAVGYAGNGIVLLFAVEGGNLPNYSGINLPNLAQLLKSFNCIDAINLDGGGSTSFKVNGLQTVRPSENGMERVVSSVILIKRR